MEKPADKVKSWPEELREEWEERAAIIEFDGKQTRENAELIAFQQIIKAQRK